MTPDDETLIRRALEEWIIWRDTGEWDRFLALWHPRGRMVATWFNGSAQEFVARSKATFGRGAWAHHELGGTAVRIEGARGIAESRITLHLRTNVDGILCDISCLGRFVDFMIRGEDRWCFALRHPVYEKDWLRPATPGAVLQIDQELLAEFPTGYRYLGYSQAKVGMTVDRGLPGSDGPEMDLLKARAEAWLRGAPQDEFLS